MILNVIGINFGRPHKRALLTFLRSHPAMAAGVADHIWKCEEIAALLDKEAGTA